MLYTFGHEPRLSEPSGTVTSEIHGRMLVRDTENPSPLPIKCARIELGVEYFSDLELVNGEIPPLHPGTADACLLQRRVGREGRTRHAARRQAGLEPKLELGTFREYAAAVVKATDDYLASATDADMEKVVDAGFAPPMPVSTFIGNILLWHVATHQGEISALKGVQGLNGLDMTH